jgi:hypothetical protein
MSHLLADFRTPGAVHVHVPVRENLIASCIDLRHKITAKR